LFELVFYLKFDIYTNLCYRANQMNRNKKFLDGLFWPMKGV